ncbi:MFS transporter [Streptomyces sp. NP160]|uniref:MFS transporter n=1 Tax=Streptomyces sp. NP160 TaxID=2586637 RepID=UPI001118EF3B|nr:MFS transporter [Streptomyces sp. NP160]TNM67080.1 MFS transporter [Streptomyces sp. NP160]
MNAPDSSLPSQPSAPRRSRGGAALVTALVVDSLGNGLFLPLSLVFFLQLTDVPLALLGLLLTLANAVTLPAPVWVGTLVDRFGARPLVVAAQLLQAVGFAAYALVHGPVGVFAASALVAVGVRVFWSSVFTAIAEHAEADEAARPGQAWSKDTWFSVANGARTAGLAIGGLATGVVIADGRDGTYVAVAYASAVCFGVAALLIAVVVPSRHRTRPEDTAGQPAAAEDEPTGYRALLRDRPFAVLTALNTVYALTSMMLGLALPTVVLTVLEAPAWLTAAVLAGNAALIAVLSAPVGLRTPRYRRTRVLAVAAGLWTAWAAGMALLAPGRLGVVVVVVVSVTLLFTAAELLHAPASTALAAAAAPDGARGRYLAVFQYSFTAASIVAPAFFTTLASVTSALPWLALAALNAVSVVVLLRLEQRLPAAALREGPAVGPA